jgi:hypothetical protein
MRSWAGVGAVVGVAAPGAEVGDGALGAIAGAFALGSTAGAGAGWALATAAAKLTAAKAPKAEVKGRRSWGMARTCGGQKSGRGNAAQGKPMAADVST